MPAPDVTITLNDADSTETVGQGKKVAWKNGTTDRSISINLPDCLAGNPASPVVLAAGVTSSTYNVPPGQAKQGYDYTFTVGAGLDTLNGTITVN